MDRKLLWLLDDDVLASGVPDELSTCNTRHNGGALTIESCAGCSALQEGYETRQCNGAGGGAANARI
jgi:hypothetical protein